MYGMPSRTVILANMMIVGQPFTRRPSTRVLLAGGIRFGEKLCVGPAGRAGRAGQANRAGRVGRTGRAGRVGRAGRSGWSD